MPLKFKCNHCDAEIISKFLKVGEDAKCKSCGKVSTIPEDSEGVSESQLKEDHTISDVFNGNDSKLSPSKSNIEKPKSKYPALNTISGIYQFLAILVGIGSVIGLFYGLNLMTQYGGKPAGIGIIIYSLIAGLLVVISLLAISEGIKLFISIENNTSEQNKLLGKLINKIK
jgi:uncharacterized paraquat-inducible protein A